MLDCLITSQTRIILLRKFFLNTNIKAHLRGLEAEFGESSNSFRVELNRFEKSGLLVSSHIGNRKLFQANQNHPLFNELHNIVLKETGIDRLIASIINHTGDLACIYLTGGLACGRNSRTIDILLVGENIDIKNLNGILNRTGRLIGKRINLIFAGAKEACSFLEGHESNTIYTLWERANKLQSLE